MDFKEDIGARRLALLGLSHSHQVVGAVVVGAVVVGAVGCSCGGCSCVGVP